MLDCNVKEVWDGLIVGEHNPYIGNGPSTGMGSFAAVDAVLQQDWLPDDLDWCPVVTLELAQPIVDDPVNVVVAVGN